MPRRLNPNSASDDGSGTAPAGADRKFPEAEVNVTPSGNCSPSVDENDPL
jgi:hypothetical protein